MKKSEQVSEKIPTANRQYKDTVFRMLFSEKENALSLYNALNGTNYGMEDGLKIVTLEDAIYLTMKNDVAVCLCDSINLWEQQSSVNPNMPLRGLMYFSKEYEGWLSANQKYIYGEKQVKSEIKETTFTSADSTTQQGIKVQKVINKKGFTLPTTGGIGTFVFTFAGIAMMAAAVILLITGKKKKAE